MAIDYHQQNCGNNCDPSSHREFTRSKRELRFVNLRSKRKRYKINEHYIYTQYFSSFNLVSLSFIPCRFRRQTIDSIPPHRCSLGSMAPMPERYDQSLKKQSHVRSPFYLWHQTVVFRIF